MKALSYWIAFSVVSVVYSEGMLGMDLQQRKGKVLNTPGRINKVFAKYGLSPVSESSMRHVRSAAAEVDLSSALVDVEYIGQVGVGTPPQFFQMDLDTGSSDIWVPSSFCETCGTHTRFDPSNSSSFSSIKGSKMWSLRYGDGSTVHGTTAAETIHFGNVSYPHQSIGLVSTETPDLAKDLSLDGIFGLGFPELSYTGLRKSIVQSMYDAGAIKALTMGVWLGRARDGGHGEVMFGGTNPAHYQDNIQYLPVTTPKYWQVSFEGISVDNQTLLNNVSMEAILDTGTTLIILPYSLSKAVHAQIKGAEYSAEYGWRMPCHVDSGTILTFHLGGHTFPMAAADLVREKSLPGNDSLCYSGIAEADMPLTIMGDTFLRSYYSVYDYGQQRIGLAPVKKGNVSFS